MGQVLVALASDWERSLSQMSNVMRGFGAASRTTGPHHFSAAGVPTPGKNRCPHRRWRGRVCHAVPDPARRPHPQLPDAKHNHQEVYERFTSTFEYTGPAADEQALIARMNCAMHGPFTATSTNIS